MSTEQIRKEFESWYMAEKAKAGCALHRLGAWDAWQAAINQSATVTALVQERDAMRRVGIQQEKIIMAGENRIAELEAQLAAQPVAVPLTNFLMADAFTIEPHTDDVFAAYQQGIRFAERYHGINAAAQGAQEGGT